MKMLTPKQQRFVEEYLVDLNATQAAIRAGYSEKTAFQIGPENLKKPKIAEAVAEAQGERSKRTAIDQDWIIDGLVANVDKAGAMDPPNLAASNRARELLGKNLGMFKEPVPANDVINITKIERIIVHPDTRGAI